MVTDLVKQNGGEENVLDEGKLQQQRAVPACKDLVKEDLD